jgi:hypothetical protein
MERDGWMDEKVDTLGRGRFGNTVVELAFESGF